MQTRRSNNLKSQHIFDIISDDPDGRSKTKRIPSVMRRDEHEDNSNRTRRRVAIERKLLEEPKSPNNSPSPIRAIQQLASNPMEIRMSDTQRDLMNAQRELVETQKTLIEQLKMYNTQAPPRKAMTEEHVAAVASVASVTAEKPVITGGERFLVLDTESFQIETELGESTIVPLQIAWAVYEWSERANKLELLFKRACYISEIMCTQRFRQAIQAFSKACYLKHEAKMKSSGYPLVTISDFLNKLSTDVIDAKVQTVTAYNISWDLSGIANLMQLYGIVHPSFDSACDNPLNPMRVSHVDLMHEVVKKYGRHLIKAGVTDGTVRRSASGNKVMLRKDNNKFSKSVYSAEYVLQNFFKISQQHTADDDVEHESLILERLIQDFGVSALEFGVFYPQRSPYQVMLKIAQDEVGEADVEEIDDDLAAAILESLATKPLKDKVVCLFKANEEESD